MNKSPRRQSSDAVTLLLALVPFLVEHSPISVSETASHFGVDEQEIIDSVNFLVLTGVPDSNGTIWTGDMFDIDFELFNEGRGEIQVTNDVGLTSSPRLSAREAATIAAGLNVLQNSTTGEKRTEIESLIGKIAAGAAAKNLPFIIRPLDTPQAVLIAREAIESDLQVSFSYINAHGEESWRLIDPLLVEYEQHAWFVRGWCHYRNEQRIFRADRMTDCLISESSRCVSHLAPPGDMPIYAHNATDLIALVSYPVWASARVVGYGPDVAHIDEGRVYSHIHFSSTSSAIRLVANNPGICIVEEPRVLREAVREWAESAG